MGHVRYRHVEWDSRGQKAPVQKVKDSKGGKRRYKRWMPEGGRDIQVDVRYAPGRVAGENWVQ